MTVAPRACSQADKGTQALRVGSRMTVTEAPSGIFAHRRSRSAVVVRNSTTTIGTRLARRPGWPGGRPDRQCRCPTSLHSWHGPFTGVTEQSVLHHRPVHVPQGCDHPDIQKQGSDSIIGRRVPEQGCTCVGRLVWSTITVEESSSRSLRSQISQARRTDPTHPT
jgi:hypothetical protein